MDRVKVGVIGCGAISAAYLGQAKNWPILDVAACADLNREAAESRAKEFNVPRVLSVDELLDDPEIEIVVNLTIPAAHAEIAIAALERGKHVWNEKPLAASREDGLKEVETARRTGRRLGGAPDTFFGAGHQTARKLIDQGAIGQPVAASAFMLGRGHEGWHPSPEFYYQVGGGPMFDMGPYYLTDLLQLLGPIDRVTGFAAIAIPERTITSKPKFGQKIDVETPDHIAGSIQFKNGVIGTIATSFAVRFAEYHPITIFGTDGTLKVPDPNGFDGEVLLRREGDEQWQSVPVEHCTGYGRMVGVADMAFAIRHNRPHRGSAEQVFAVLDAMQGFLDASETGQAHKLTMPYERPAPLPTGLEMGTFGD